MCESGIKMECSVQRHVSWTSQDVQHAPSSPDQTGCSQTLDLHHICFNKVQMSYWLPFSPCAPKLPEVKLTQRVCEIRCYCPCDTDALLSTKGHVSVNIYYQNPKTNVWWWPGCQSTVCVKTAGTWGSRGQSKQRWLSCCKWRGSSNQDWLGWRVSAII